MGGGQSQSFSQGEIAVMTQEFYTFLPGHYIDVSIDESILTYSGLDSTARLNSYSTGLVSQLDQIPVYTEKVGNALAGLSAVPNAVGLGALVISMILQFAYTATKNSQTTLQTPVDTLLRRVFAEEKASGVRDLMGETLKRHRMYLRNDQQLLEETRHLERDLSKQLTVLKNSMLSDGHMSSRSLKHWANGAAFHAQMLIHMARLQRKNGDRFKIARDAAVSAVDTYRHEMSDLLQKYKEYKTSKFHMWSTYIPCPDDVDEPMPCGYRCSFDDADVKSYQLNPRSMPNKYCVGPSPKDYTNYIFSKHAHIIQLKTYFSDLQNNVSGLCNKEGTFILKT